MKYTLFILLNIGISFISNAQFISSIIIESQEHDEPPTKEGRPKYLIKFEKQKNGDFIAKSFYEADKKKKLKKAAIIEKSRIDRFQTWKKPGKKEFNLNELDLDFDELKSTEKSYKYELINHVEEQMILHMDSFSICQPGSMRTAIVTGGERITVTTVDDANNEEKVIFDLNGLSKSTFNVQQYLIYYSLFLDRLPKRFPDHGYFDRNTAQEVVLFYQEIIQCKGFYFKLWVDENPTLTPSEKRTKWNYTEYMKSRVTKP